MTSLYSAIDKMPIIDTAKTVLETDEGDIIALFTSRRDYVPMQKTRIRINGDQAREVEVSIEALRDLANAIRAHADHLDATAGGPASAPAPTPF